MTGRKRAFSTDSDSDEIHKNDQEITNELTDIVGDPTILQIEALLEEQREAEDLLQRLDAIGVDENEEEEDYEVDYERNNDIDANDEKDLSEPPESAESVDPEETASFSPSEEENKDYHQPTVEEWNDDGEQNGANEENGDVGEGSTGYEVLESDEADESGFSAPNQQSFSGRDFIHDDIVENSSNDVSLSSHASALCRSRPNLARKNEMPLPIDEEHRRWLRRETRERLGMLGLRYVDLDEYTKQMERTVKAQSAYENPRDEKVAQSGIEQFRFRMKVLRDKREKETQRAH